MPIMIIIIIIIIIVNQRSYTYQAMVYDLVVQDGGKYMYSTTSAKGEEVKNEVYLNEDDPLWVQMRHMHIADAIEHVIQDFNLFLKVTLV